MQSSRRTAGQAPGATGWLLRLLLFAATFHLLAAATLWCGKLPYDLWPIRQGSTFLSLIGGAATPILGLLGIHIVIDLAGVLRGRTVPPLKQRCAYGGRLLLWGVLLAVIYGWFQIPYVNLKAAIPLLNPAAYDAQLETLERWLCGGELPSAWLVERCSRAALVLWDGVYHTFGFFLFLSLAVALHISGLRTGARLVLALGIGLCMDVLVTLLYPTTGPLFVHPERFTALQDLPSGGLARFLARTVEAYAADPTRGVYALAGISAMPSFHVCAWTCALFCWRGLPRWLLAATGLACALNWASTVVLGWHYALDGLVGIVMAILIWRWTDRLIGAASPVAGIHEPEGSSDDAPVTTHDPRWPDAPRR